MPAIIANSENFLRNSDFPADEIIYMSTGSITVGALSFLDTMIPHELPFTPLMDGTWSPQSNFDLSYDIGTGPIGGSLFSINNSIEANQTNITIRVVNSTNASVIFYYRIFGFEPSNSLEDVNFTSNLADRFVIDSGYNYSKLFARGVANANTTITHAVGHRVQTVIWSEFSNGVISKQLSIDLGNPLTYILTKVTEDNVQIIFVSPPSGFLAHYRVYLDE